MLPHFVLRWMWDIFVQYVHTVCATCSLAAKAISAIRSTYLSEVTHSDQQDGSGGKEANNHT